MADWLGRDDDTVRMLNDMLSGQRSDSLSWNGETDIGRVPIFGSYTESRPRLPPQSWERETTPSRMGSIGTYANIGPALGVLSASGASRPDGSVSVYPNAGIQAGPLNLRGGLAVEPDQPVRPNFGFGVGMPLGDKGSVSADLSVTPGYGQVLGLAAAYGISPDLLISALLSHSRFDSGQASDTRGGVGLRYKFPTPRRVFEPEAEIKPGSGRYQ